MDKAIRNILNSYKDIGGINLTEGANLPSKKSVHDILDLIRNLLFPGYFEPIQDGHLENVITLKSLELQEKLPQEVGKKFILEIPALRAILKTDIQAIFDGDPAAKSEEEIILAYPGFQAITVYRIANFFYKENLPLIPRIMTEIAHSETGIDINPGATIGERFCIDHGTGIVIGETTHIGKNVKLYQGVTLGALSVHKAAASQKRHPTIEDNVTIYAHATILGGETIIGEGSTIGGNVWLIDSVEKNAKIYVDNKQKLIIKHKKP
jgi:serine O-acetyltransferase